jgi:hypothetical protein
MSAETEAANLHGVSSRPLEQLERRARQSGHWTGDHPLTVAILEAILTERIQRLDVANARLDIERFIADPQPLAI